MQNNPTFLGSVQDVQVVRPLSFGEFVRDAKPKGNIQPHEALLCDRTFFERSDRYEIQI